MSASSPRVAGRRSHRPPYEGACPEPVEGACPEPVEGACPEPVEGACPEPVEGACPEPVEGGHGGWAQTRSTRPSVSVRQAQPSPPLRRGATGGRRHTKYSPLSKRPPAQAIAPLTKGGHGG